MAAATLLLLGTSCTPVDIAKEAAQLALPDPAPAEGPTLPTVYVVVTSPAITVTTDVNGGEVSTTRKDAPPATETVAQTSPYGTQLQVGTGETWCDVDGEITPCDDLK